MMAAANREKTLLIFLVPALAFGAGYDSAVTWLLGFEDASVN